MVINKLADLESLVCMSIVVTKAQRDRIESLSKHIKKNTGLSSVSLSDVARMSLDIALPVLEKQYLPKNTSCQ